MTRVQGSFCKIYRSFSLLRILYSFENHIMLTLLSSHLNFFSKFINRLSNVSSWCIVIYFVNYLTLRFIDCRTMGALRNHRWVHRRPQIRLRKYNYISLFCEKIST